MSRIVISLFKDGEEKKVVLDKERFVIGRDKASDLVLDHSSISRRHAILVKSFEHIYVENVSSTGSLLKNGESIEYAELEEGQDVVIGPYTLHWRTEVHESAPLSTEAPADAVEEAGNLPQMDAVGEEAPPAVEGEVQDAPPPLVNEEAPAPEAEASPSFEAVNSDDKTQVVASGVRAVIKVTRGEVLGREIRLDNGLSWIVGRSPKCHIQVDNAKLSRQHFKIIKIGNVFRVEDMGSANGTRVNGVAVTDAPLKPFDSIQAGPVELQFLLLSANAQLAPGALALPAPEAGASNAGFGEMQLEGQDRTAFAPPVPYVAPTDNAGNTHIGPPPGMPGASEAAFASTAGMSTPSSASPEEKKSPIAQRIAMIGAWYQAQPKQKKILYASAAAVLLLALIVGLQPKDDTKALNVAAPDKAAQPALEQANAALSPDISPEFAMLPTDKKNEIYSLYARAEEAKKNKDWKTAFDSARTILSSVKRFKNTHDILSEAQDHINEDNIGSISSLNGVDDARRENEEQIKLLVASGDKALEESRWSDAEEAFSKAMNLDPSSAKAARGYAAARAKDRGLVVEVPKPVIVDPDADAKQAERDSIDGLKKQFQEARARVNDGKFREGLPILKDLEEKVQDRLHEYHLGKRAPASIRNEFAAEVRQLQVRVREGLDTVKTQLRAEYQTQLSDADQFQSNRQYIQAREIYDRILRSEPAFEEVEELRGRLYLKILAEAKTVYQESLIYESVGDLENATEGFRKTRDLLTNVQDASAVEYYKRSNHKLKRLQQ